MIVDATVFLSSLPMSPSHQTICRLWELSSLIETMIKIFRNEVFASFL